MKTEEKKPSNPSVFPDPMRGAEQSFSNQCPWQLEQGMTLRDYFAANAMQGLIANEQNFDYLREQTPLAIARDSYLLADTMLKQREL